MFFFKKKSKEEKFIELFSDAMNTAQENAKKIGDTIVKQQRPDSLDYGKCESNPICTFSLESTKKYLSRICTKEGKTFTWSNYNSIRTDIYDFKDVPEDKYTIFLDGKPYCNLYFCLYFGETRFPPAGLYFIDDDTDWDLEREAYTMGVTVDSLILMKEIEKEEEKIKEEEKVHLLEQAEELKQKYYDFNLEEAMKDSVFSGLIKGGCDLKLAYEYINKDMLFEKKQDCNVNSGLSDLLQKYNFEYYYKLLYDYERGIFEESKKENSIIQQNLYNEFKDSENLENLIKSQEIERENMELWWMKTASDLAEWATEACATKSLFPKFELMEDWQNDSFRNLINHVEMPIAYEIIHFFEYYE